VVGSPEGAIQTTAEKRAGCGCISPDSIANGVSQTIFQAYLHGAKPEDVVEPEATAEICTRGDIVCDLKLHLDEAWYEEGAMNTAATTSRRNTS
jgi:hypothetical protein